MEDIREFESEDISGTTELASEIKDTEVIDNIEEIQEDIETGDDSESLGQATDSNIEIAEDNENKDETQETGSIEEIEEDVDKKENFDEEKETLTAEERRDMKERSGWDDDVIDNIRSVEEYKIYEDAGLREAEVGDKKCLIRDDIDWEQKDSMGRSNRERAEQGLSSINKDGETIELHHIGQHADSPLAELTMEQHRGKNNDTILHDKTKESEIDRQAFAQERSKHWEARASM